MRKPARQEVLSSWRAGYGSCGAVLLEPSALQADAFGALLRLGGLQRKALGLQVRFGRLHVLACGELGVGVVGRSRFGFAAQLRIDATL